jgi:hypothetical protein
MEADPISDIGHSIKRTRPPDQTNFACMTSHDQAAACAGLESPPSIASSRDPIDTRARPRLALIDTFGRSRPGR